jgi:hypothetical protein
MRTRIATAMTSGTASDAARVLATDLRAQLGEDPPVLVLAFASTSQPLGEVTAALVKEFPGATILGASTAGEFTEKGDAKGGVSAFALVGDFRVFAGMGTGQGADPQRAVADAVLGLPRTVEGYDCRTGLLLLDPLAGNAEEVTLLLGVHFEGDETLAGGRRGMTSR